MKKILILLCCCHFGYATTPTVNKYISNYIFANLEKRPQEVLKFLFANAAYDKEVAYVAGIMMADLGAVDLAQHFLQLAEKENFAPAMNALGDLYYSKKQVKKALIKYIKAANNGFAPAQFNAGVVCLELQDHKNAIHFLEMAIKNKKLDADMKKSANKYLQKAKSCDISENQKK